jgi:hypothetical protein
VVDLTKQMDFYHGNWEEYLTKYVSVLKTFVKNGVITEAQGRRDYAEERYILKSDEWSTPYQNGYISRTQQDFPDFKRSPRLCFPIETDALQENYTSLR